MRLRYQWLVSLLLVSLLVLTANQIIQTLFFGQRPIDPDHLEAVYDPNPPQAYFNNQPISVPQAPIADASILGDNTSGAPKRIEVDLTQQRLYAYEGDRLVYNFLISSGKWNRTPTGTFTIWTKIRSQKMEGGSKLLGDYYYLPNVPYIMFFANDQVGKSLGFSLHGTYWHHNFGVPMSHGCINMKTEEIAILYQWSSVGLPVTIYGKYQY